MQKFEWKKELKEIYFPKVGVVSEVKVPKINYLMIDGTGDPNNSTTLADAFSALYPIAYTIKFDLKSTARQDFTVFPPEGLWFADDMSVFMENNNNKSSWKWTIMIAQPDYVTKADFVSAQDVAFAKKNLPKIKEVRFEALEEGDSVQILHIGPYSAEGPNILKLHDYIKEHGWKLAGKHHEIYMSDPRRVGKDKMKTVIRQPFKKL
ncbi:MAG TPA: GyrI-like domain-containing protein [Patescibacteria group bacterium]|nr:GyrI-like domain-containing protein [Patescibacteria group bacterium]